MKNNSTFRNFLIWVLIFSLGLIFFEFLGNAQLNVSRIAFSDFLSQADSGQITEVVIKGDLIEGKTSDGKRFSTLSPNYPNLVDRLSSHNIKIEVASTESALGTFFAILLSWFPLLLLIGVWIFFMRQMQGGAGKAMGFGKSKAKMLSEKNNNITFADVAGVDEAKEELREIVDFLKDPNKYQKLGGKIPKGGLLVGSPGTGKTLLAKAVAGEAKVPFFTISGSDFVEMFVGVGASRVRDMFEQAKKHAPCIIFIDEIDAVGRHRGAGLGGGNDEREQTLNQLLVEMDGFATNQGVIVLAATNRPDVLDPALLRPGRFDRQIVVPAPDINGREQILKVHSAKVPLGPDVNIRTVARGTPGFSGADLANIVNEAALLAARKNRNIVTMQEMEEARDKVMMGVERKTMVMKDEEKSLTAYHEGGHALVTVYMPASDPIHKATIIPRGRALGLVMRLPEDDRFSVTKERLEADLAIAMGGRVAEEIILGPQKITTGASSDIKMATSLARRMVTQWGMSDKIGPVLVGDEQEEIFLGHSLGRENRKSDTLNSTIDSEVKRIIEDAYATAKNILTKNIDQLHLIAKALLEYETLSGDEINELLKNGKISRKIGDESATPSSSIPSSTENISPAKRTRRNTKKDEE
ncbi:MAG: ATP-dependent zinc metalloprotease FtsH [Alphaproteobacteria bacterium]|nr:ATP-dependent zinc metalloprotease FtsH [Candidatus Jidaibacter sp.]